MHPPCRAMAVPVTAQKSTYPKIGAIYSGLPYQCYLHSLLKSYYNVSSVSDLYLHIITKFWIRCYPYICLRLAAQKVIPTLQPGALFRAHIQKRESRIIADRVNTLKDHVYDITGGCLPLGDYITCGRITSTHRFAHRHEFFIHLFKSAY